jgi:preprotein translocase subunit SecA
VLKLIPDFVEETIKLSADNANKPETWDIDVLNQNIEQRLLPQGTGWATREKLDNWDYEFILEKLIDATVDAYEEKIENYKEEGFNYHDLEKYVFLRNVDTKWIDHIDSMDQLRKGISLRAYGHVDPVVEYKNESLDMFEDLTYSIQNDTVKLLLKAELKKVPVKQEEKKDLVTNQTGPARPVTVKGKVGRNEPCPCGSGKKYKDCCGK